MNKRAYIFFLLTIGMLTISGCSTDASKHSSSSPDISYPIISYTNNKVSFKPTREFLNLQKHKSPISVWENQDKTRVYRIDLDRELLTIIEKQDNKFNLETTIDVGRGPVGVIGNKEDTLLFVTNMKEGSLSVVNVASRQVERKLQLGYKPYCLTFSADQKVLYVVNRFGDRVFKIDPINLEMLGVTHIHKLDIKVRRDSCYGSCHKDKRNRMNLAIDNRKSILSEEELNVKLDELKLFEKKTYFSEESIKALRVQAENM